MARVTTKEKNELRLPVFKKNGEKSAEEVSLHPDIFQARVNMRLLHIVVTAYGANQRRGTHSTKERASVRGGGKKPWKQKGTGRARAGSSRSPLWRGGGTTFGPHPRDYSTKIPKALKQKALISALSHKLKEGNVRIVEDLVIEEPKTREVANILKALEIRKAKTLCVLPAVDGNLVRASRNLNYVISVKEARDVSAYHVMRKKNLLLGREALPVLEQRLLGAEMPAKDSGLASEEVSV